MFLGIDLGTGSVKALLLDVDGAVIHAASVEYPVLAPHHGWAESNPQDWWEATRRAVRKVTEGEEVRAVGFSGQMHGVVLCDADGEPLRDAILWADTRTGRQLDAYRNLDEEILRRFANPPAVGMAGPSLLWLRDEEPEKYRAARWALQPKDWMRLRLTGEAAAEPSDASATLLYDLEGDRWYDELTEALGLNGGFLAPLSASTEIAGILTDVAARDLGLSSGVPVAVGAADTAASIVGTGLNEPGTFQLTVGTGAQIAVLCERFAPDATGRTHLFRTAPPTDAPYYAMAAMQNAGLSLEWVRRVLGVSWEEFYEEAFANGVQPGSSGLVFVPHLSGERTPGFDAKARGAWRNLGLEHGRGHLLRAALEGVAFSIREGLDALEDATNLTPDTLRLAGGGTSDERWREMLANVLDKHLAILPDTVASNASSVGAATFAGLSSGDLDAPIEVPDPSQFVEPDGASDYEEAYARYREG